MFKLLVLSAIISTALAELPGEYLQEYASSYDDYKPRDYHYSYGVSDHHTGDHKSHWETRENGVVRGAYSLLEPDGTTRLVEYIADDNGFRAVVKKLGGDNHHEVPIVPQVPISLLPEVPTYTTKINQEIPFVQSDPGFTSYNGQINNYVKSEVPTELLNIKSSPIDLSIPTSLVANIPEFSLYNGQIQSEVPAELLNTKSNPILANIPEFSINNDLKSEVPTDLIATKSSSLELPELASLITNVPDYSAYNWKLSGEVPLELITAKQQVPQLVPEYPLKNGLPSELFAGNSEPSYLSLYGNNFDNYKLAPSFYSIPEYTSPKLEKSSYEAPFSHQSFSMQNTHQDAAFSSGNPGYISNDQSEGYGTAFSHKVYHVVPAPQAKRSIKHV